MGLRDIELTLPPGFRFYPSDEELVCHYLHNKVVNERFGGGAAMVEVDLHTHEPWELPDVAKLSTNEWYFFSFRDRKYATGLRTNRATKSGYWKATGKDRVIHNPKGRAVVGMRKTLVFYRGRAPNGIKTSWVMHEFRMENPHTPPKEDWVLCRVFNKKKADEMMELEYSMENEQAITSVRGCNPSSHGTDYSPPFPSLSTQLPVSEAICLPSDASAMANMALLHYNIFDFPPPVSGGSSRDGGECGLLLDYDSLMEM